MWPFRAAGPVSTNGRSTTSSSARPARCTTAWAADWWATRSAIARSNGGDDQAVYAYARRTLDHWQVILGRDLLNRMFGENLTTSGLDVTNARIGEQWAVGASGLRLECRAREFRAGRSRNGWRCGLGKTFTRRRARCVPEVLDAGPVRAGDQIEVIHRPAHDITRRAGLPRDCQGTGAATPPRRDSSPAR